MDEFENALPEIFEVESVRHDDVLQSFDCWDSLTVLSILALADSKCKVALTSNEVVGCKTIGNLLNLIQEKRNGK